MKALFSILLGILCLFSCLLAQQPLSLGEAIATSLKQNYGIQIADIRTQLAATQNTWGNAGALPRVDLNLNGRYFQSGNPASFLRSNQSLSPGLSLNWTLFDGFAMMANKMRFQLLQEQAMGNAAVVVETNIQAVMLAYGDALVAQEATRVLQEVLDNSKAQLAFEEYRLETGASSTFELLQFKNAVVVDSANLINQQLVLRNVTRTLNQLMNMPLDAQYTLADTLKTEFQAYALSDLQESIRQDNNNLRNQYLAQQIRSEETRVAEALRYPSLSLNANGNYTLGRAGLIDGTNRDVQAPDFSVGFTLSFNLFNGFNTERQITVARLNERVTELETRDLIQSLESELFVIYDNYEARRALLALQAENVDNAQLNLELANERFQNGLLNTFDYRQIQLQYLNAQLDRLRALRDLYSSQTELTRLIGGLVRES